MNSVGMGPKRQQWRDGVLVQATNRHSSQGRDGMCGIISPVDSVYSGRRLALSATLPRKRKIKATRAV